jgi:hypothetical protein
MRGNTTEATGTGAASGPWGLWASHYCIGTTGHGGANPRCSVKTDPDFVLDRSQDMEFQTLTVPATRDSRPSCSMAIPRRGPRARRRRRPVPAPPTTRWPVEGWVTVKNGTVTSNDKVWRKFTFPPVTTSKIRVVVTAARLNYTRIVEIEAWGNATSRKNVALASNGATATASSTLDNDRLPLAAINGDRKGSHWGSDPSTGSGWHDASASDFDDDWLQVEFAGPRTINEIDLFSVQDTWNSPSTPTETMTCSLVGLIDFQVQYWTGSQWAVVPGGTITGNNLVWRRLTFLPLTTSRIRVVVTNGGNHYSRIAELEALMPYDFLSSVTP